MPPRISIILPAYNEAQTIERAIRESFAIFKGLSFTSEMIVVDDGSQDQTAVIVRRLAAEIPEVHLVCHSSNMGKGKAVQRGVAEAQGDLLLFFDCDLSTHPSEIHRFLPYLEEADVLIGSRRVAGAFIQVSQPFYRVQIGRVLNFLFRMFFGLPYRDTQCGFKMFTRQAADKIFPHLQTTGWVFDVEILLRARAAAFRIREVPITWRNGRESRVRLDDAWRILRDLWTLRSLR